MERKASARGLLTLELTSKRDVVSYRKLWTSLVELPHDKRSILIILNIRKHYESIIYVESDIAPQLVFYKRHRLAQVQPQVQTTTEPLNHGTKF